MNGSSRENYLRSVLDLDAIHDASGIIAQRRAFLDRDDSLVAAEAKGHEIDNPRRALNEKLNRVRQMFWTADEAEIVKQLGDVQQCEFKEIVEQANQLQQRTPMRTLVAAMNRDAKVHDVFSATLAEILIASPSDKYRIKEEHLRIMRPAANPHYRKSLRSIKKSVKRIRKLHPQIFDAESEWMNELLRYNPRHESYEEVTVAGCIYGILLLALGFSLLLALIVVPATIFSK